MVQDQLTALVDAITQELDAINRLRDETLTRSRALIRSCALSIRAIHRHELTAARQMLDQALQEAAEMVTPLRPHPDLYHTGYTQDALKELVEAYLVYHFVSGGRLPLPAELHVTGATYLKGMAEAATEMRRFALDLIRRGQVEAAEPYLTVMDDVYSLLVTVDFPDAVTLGLRRQTDLVRSVLERTRGDLTLAVRQEQMRRALREFEERLGMESSGDEGPAEPSWDEPAEGDGG